MTSNNTRIYLYGGFNGTKEFGDLYAFNPSSNSFTRLENTSSKDTTKPPPKQVLIPDLIEYWKRAGAKNKNKLITSISLIRFIRFRVTH
jgi:hypothetical protein